VRRSICELADYYNALVFVDESHSSGFFGRTGRLIYTADKLVSHVDMFYCLR